MADDILNDDGLEEDGKQKKRRGRRNKKEKAPAAAQAQPNPGGDGDEEKGGKSLSERVVDLWNMIKIVGFPKFPSGRIMAALIAAFFLGILAASVPLSPSSVEFYNGSPYQMQDIFQDQYVLGVAASAVAGTYDQSSIENLLREVEAPSERIAALQEQYAGTPVSQGLDLIAPWADGIDGKTAPSSPNIFGSLLQIIFVVILFVVLVLLFAVVWGYWIVSWLHAFWERIRPKSEEDIAKIADAKKAADERRKAAELRRQMEEEAASAAATDLGAPLITRPSIYTKGRAYDDSFAIEDADDMFLGETGATIAKTIGEGQDLAAVEVWLFDKDDFVKTYTKVFVSEHGYNDPVTMSDLEARVDDKADIMVLKPGTEVQLESNNLLVKAKVVDVQPGTDSSLPPNSHFEGMTIQMQAWEKNAEASPAAAPAGGAVPPPPPPSGGLPDLSSYEIGPPPEMPSSSGATPPPPPPATPSSSGQRDLSDYEIGPPPPGVKPLTPPPMGQSGGTPPPPAPGTLPPFDDDDEDDPFGGTGDFTPSGY